LPCDEPWEHECSRACHLYSINDERRAFATQVGVALTPLQLQAMMRHKDFRMTQRYINLAPRIAGLWLPCRPRPRRFAIQVGIEQDGRPRLP
jgi:hypothetical protein